MLKPKKFKDDENGQALVEALIVLILLLGLFATIIFYGNYGSMTQKGHTGARMVTLETAAGSYAFPYENSEANGTPPSHDNTHFDEFGFPSVVSAIFDWICGTREGYVRYTQTGKIIGGGQNWLSPFSTKFDIKYLADHNSWKADVGTVEAAFIAIGVAIVMTDYSLEDLTGSGGGVPSDASNQWERH